MVVLLLVVSRLYKWRGWWKQINLSVNYRMAMIPLLVNEDRNYQAGSVNV